MSLFTHRSAQKELLDGDGIPFDAIRQNMQELDVINHRLGGHRITQKGLQKLLTKVTLPPGAVVHIIEIGCGGGDNLRVLQQWCVKRNIKVRLTGIDINPECVAFAESNPKNKNIEFVCADYRSVVFAAKPHVIFSSLFCHHFSDEALVEMLQWLQHNTVIGFFINDLQRHPLAYYSIALLTKTFSKSYLVKNDAPLSVLRSFVKKDWQRLFQKAGILQYTCRWQWAFRWLLVYQH